MENMPQLAVFMTNSSNTDNLREWPKGIVKINGCIVGQIKADEETSTQVQMKCRREKYKILT